LRAFEYIGDKKGLFLYSLLNPFFFLLGTSESSYSATIEVMLNKVQHPSVINFDLENVKPFLFDFINKVKRGELTAAAINSPQNPGINL